MIYGEPYILQKTDRIFLYGAATTGAVLYANLTKRGFHIDAFIDQRADEIESYYDLPVWLPGEAGRRCGEAAVVVAIKNVFEHERVAAMLWRAGFQKIIFRPYGSVCGEETEPERRLNQVYDRIMEKDGAGELPPCPDVQGAERQVLKDRAVLLDQGGYVTANIPAPYVFTDKYEGRDIIWGDIPCMGLLPHLALFDVFNGKWNPDYTEYMKYCREAAERSGGIVTSKAWEASVYQNRLDVFNHMQYSWEHDRDFFVRNAVEGVYNQKGYFNIRSGKHRITYMLAKGSRYIPLRIRKADYETWRDKDRAERIADYLWENHRESLPVTLANPYFYDYPNDAAAFYERVLSSLLTAFYRAGFLPFRGGQLADRTVLFYHTPMALYAKIFHMLGFAVSICENGRTRMDLNELLLSGVPYRTLTEAEAGEGEYAAAVLEDPERNVRARFTAVIRGEAAEKTDVFGLTGAGPRYAYMNFGESGSREQGACHAVWK